MQETGPLAAIISLAGHSVRFIVVGGVAATLHGAPLLTFDLDVVYSRDPANLDRLLPFLEDADAYFRIQPERRPRPNRSHLAGTGPLNLATRFGAVDLLATVGANLGYDDLLPHCGEMDLGDGLRILVLTLETVIRLKEQLGSEKDRAALPVLRQTLRERNRGGA